MAKPTTQIEKQVLTQVQQDAQAMGEVIGAVAQNKEALLKFLDIMNEMDQAGLLDVARGVLKARKQIGVLGVNQMNKSGAQRIIKNSISTVQFVAQIDPDQLKQVLGAVAQGLQQAKPSDKKVGMWGLMGSLRDPEVGASMSMLVNFLKGMGEGLPHVH